MSARVTRRTTAALVAVAVAAALLVAAGCGGNDEPVGTPPEPPTETEPDRTAELPPELMDPQTTPDPELLLPPLEDYVTDDNVEAGELEASLDHGAVPYVEARRRLVLDEQGFTAGEVTVVTLEPGPAGGESYLDHRYGDARRSPVELEGVEMLRVETEPHEAIAWTGPTFAVTFERGAEQSHEWLEDLARATVRAVTGA